METVGATRVTSPNKIDAKTRLADFYSKQSKRNKTSNKTDDSEKRKQLQDYVTWVNTYLKRRPGVRLICDLRSLSDGITLVQLAEIVARDTIPGIVTLPVSLADRTANIEKACDFLKQKGVNLSPELVKDIVDGSLKAAMRVVVAIADQFLPTSVRRVQPMSRPRAYTESSPSTGSRRGSSVSPNCTLNRSTGEPPQKSPSPITQLMTTTLGRNNHLPFNIHRRSYTPEMRPDSPIYSTPIDCIEGSSGEIAEGTRRPSLGRKKGRDSFNTEKQMLVLEELAQSQTEVMDMKNQMLQLFALLQRNPNSSPTAISSTPELQNASSRDSQQSDSDVSDGLITTVATSCDDQKVTSRSIDQLKEQLVQNSKVEDVKQTIGEEDEDGWLRKELEECREQLKKLKSELLRKEYKHDTEMVDAKNVISEKEIMIMTLRHELSQHREGIGRELDQLSQQLDHSHNIQGSFVAQLKEKEAEIAILRDQLQRMSSHDPLTPQLTNGTSEKHRKTVPEEMDVVRTCLGSLRKSLSAQDPQQHTIDQLEHAVASLVDLAMSSTSLRDPSPTLSRKHNSRSSKHKAHGVDESGELKYVGGRQKKHGTGSGGEVSPGMVSRSSPDEVTRVVYYLDKDDTPYRTSIPKRCCEITLKDFRNAINKSSSHKFFFKSQDPDIGQVKEEVSDSSAIVPNYEGKIIGWVSEKRK